MLPYIPMMQQCTIIYGGAIEENACLDSLMLITGHDLRRINQIKSTNSKVFVFYQQF